MKATETLLYKALAPKIRRQDRKEFARMLQMVVNSPIAVRWDDCELLGGAFLWRASPQGHDYWAELSDRIRSYDA